MQLARRIFSLLCLLVILASFYKVWQINKETRLSADDYLYSFKFEPGFASAEPAEVDYRKITSIEDYIESLQNLYNSLTGRIIPHALLQVFLILPPWLFDLLNTLAVLLLGYLFSTWIVGVRHDLRPAFWLLATMLYYLAVSLGKRNLYYPAFSINYVWTQLIVFVFLIPLRRLLQEDDPISTKIPLALTMFLLGAVAGATNEPAGPAILLGMGFMALLKFLSKSRCYPAWYYSGMAGILLGFAFLYFAPGNSERALYETSRVGEIKGIGFNPQNLMPMLRAFVNAFPVLLLGLFGIAGISVRSLSSDWRSLLFMSLSLLGTIFVLLLAPFYVPRMSMLFLGFVIIISLVLFRLRLSAKPLSLALCILVILPFFVYRLTQDHLWASRAEQEYQLFLKQLEECPSDSCNVNPRAYHESLTRANWAKPVATYYDKRYLGVRDPYAPDFLANWQNASYRRVFTEASDKVELKGIRYVEHDAYSRTLYILLESKDEELKPDSLNVVLKSIDVPEFVESALLKLNGDLLYYILPQVISFRPVSAHAREAYAIYALTMPIDDNKEDIVCINLTYQDKFRQNLFLKDLSFPG